MLASPPAPAVSALFQPLQLKSLALKNRIVMAPMSRSRSPDGIPGSDVASYYRRRAAGEVGLILSEGAVVDRPVSRNDPNMPLFHGNAALAGWQQVISDVHKAGGKMGPQLWHVGAAPSLVEGWTPPGPLDSPSGLAGPGQVSGDAMTDEAVADTITAFGRAAADAKRLGFDVVELHGAHGFLIDQFFWSATNRRTDRFGGASITERGRFGVEVIRTVRAAVGPDFPILVRLSQWKVQDYNARIASTPDEMTEWLAPLVEAGADGLHCSQRRFYEPEFAGSDLNFAGWAKKLTGAPTITVGSVGLTGEIMAAYAGEGSQPVALDEVVRRLDRGDFDLVAVGRPLLQDPQWAVKVKGGRTAELMEFEASAMATLY